MARRTARSGGGIALGWAFGVLGILCVALAVLVHHETYAPVMPAMPAVAVTPTPAPGPGPDAHAVASQAPASAYRTGSDACGMSVMQHCTAAGVSSVQLTVPGRSPFAALADLRAAVAGTAPADAVGRAPPDLSVLSRLRI